MAQIKNIKKPGDLIRGASVGLAGLDKDGNVVGYKAAAADAGKVLTVGEDGSVSFQDVPSEFPEGAQSGDVLAWGGDTGPEWRPHYPESGSEGDILTLGETGPEWAPPAGGALFNHYIYIELGSEYGSFVLTTSSAAPFNAVSFIELLYANNIDGSANNKKMWGTVHYSSGDVGSVYLNDYAAKKVSIQRGYNGSISTNELTDTRIRDTVVSV